MRLNLESLTGEPFQLRPGEGVAAHTDVIGVNEQRRREPQLFEHRVGVLQERLISIIERQYDTLLRKLLLQGDKVEELFQADNMIALSFEISHLFFECFGSKYQSSLRLRPQIVVAENRDQLVAVDIDARD